MLSHKKILAHRTHEGLAVLLHPFVAPGLNDKNMGILIGRRVNRTRI